MLTASVTVIGQQTSEGSEMPTTKIIYASSDSSIDKYPENKLNSFKFVLPSPINLVSTNKILSVAFKGIFIPGTRKQKGDRIPPYLKVHLNILNEQHTHETYHKILARVPFSNKIGYREARHSKSLALSCHSISEIGIDIETDQDKKIEFENESNCGTIVKLEISTMEANMHSFTLDCCCSPIYSEEGGPHYENTLFGFQVNLPSELKLDKANYRVGLSSAAIPADIFIGKTAMMIHIRAGEAMKPAMVHEVIISIHPLKNSDLKATLQAINHLLLEDLGYGIFVSHIEDTDQIQFEMDSVTKLQEHLKLFDKKEKKWQNRLSTIISKQEMEEYRDVKNEMPTMHHLPALNETILSWCEIKLSDSLVYALNGNLHAQEFKIDRFENTTYKLDAGKSADLTRIRARALALHVPIITETFFARMQDHLLQVLPANNDRSTKRMSKTLLYHPEHVTYHDVIRSNIKTMNLKLTDIGGLPVHQYFGYKSNFILHFKPA